MMMLRLVSFAVLVASSGADSTKENYVTANGQCYVALRSPLSWADAENDCASKGGHLASVESEDVGKALRELLNASSSQWIGATYDGLLKKWRWSGGSPFEYTKWKQGHPVNQTALCTVLNTDGEWTSNDCSVPLRYHIVSQHIHSQYSKPKYIGSQHAEYQCTECQHIGSKFTKSQYTRSQHIATQHTKSQYTRSQHIASQHTECQHTRSQHIVLQHSDYTDSHYTESQHANSQCTEELHGWVGGH